MTTAFFILFALLVFPVGRAEAQAVFAHVIVRLPTLPAEGISVSYN